MRYYDHIPFPDGKRRFLYRIDAYWDLSAVRRYTTSLLQDGFTVLKDIDPF